MRLLPRSDTGDCSLPFPNESVTRSAILSRTWGADTEEVTFDDPTIGSGKYKLGYEMLRFCGERAAQDGLGWIWIDTPSGNASFSLRRRSDRDGKSKWLLLLSVSCYHDCSYAKAGAEDVALVVVRS